MGQFLKKVREENNFTLRRVEEITGISNAYLSQLESDKIKQPSPIWLHKLAEAYDVEYSTLLSLANYPVPGENASSDINASLSARLGAVTRNEEEALVDYLKFIRSRNDSSRRKTR